MSADRPDLSVVIASVNGSTCLATCLAAIEGQEGDATAEVIIVAAAASPVPAVLRREHPRVRPLVIDGDATIPRLRAAGIRAARGSVVAITEDHCVPPPAWYASMLRAHAASDAAAIGGAVDNGATERLVDWAVYFLEYGRFSSPLPGGATDDLPGPNVSYKRRTIETLGDVIAHEYWETFVHDRLRRTGHQLWSDPSIPMVHRMHFSFWPFLAERFHYGRAFAGTRSGSLGGIERGLRATLWGLLIPLFVLRTARTTLSRKGQRMTFACCAPMVCCFAAAAALGEGVGYVCGAGQSQMRLR